MLKPHATIGYDAGHADGRAPPLAGIVMGMAISLLLWVMMVVLFLAMR